MDLLTKQRQALSEMRALLGRFVHAEIDAAVFVPTYRKLFAPFDPPDLVTDDLSEPEQRELELFIRFMGGWFGEDDDLIPKRSDWEYGANDQPYGWIDETSYRSWISAATSEAGLVL